MAGLNSDNDISFSGLSLSLLTRAKKNVRSDNNLDKKEGSI